MGESKIPNGSVEPSAPLVVVTPNASASQKWWCPQCTLVNGAHAHFCEACEGPRPQQSQDSPVNVEHEPEPEIKYTAGPDQPACPPPVYYDHSAPMKSNPASLGETEWSKKMRRRRRRRVRMVVGGAAGLIVGAIVTCTPAGVLLIGVGGAVGTRQLSKHHERKKDRRVAAQAQQVHMPPAIVT